MMPKPSQKVSANPIAAPIPHNAKLVSVRSESVEVVRSVVI